MVEDNVPEYTTEIQGTTIINHYTPEKTSATVTKAWEGDEDQLELRPKDVYIQLYADGEVYGEKVQLNEQNDWTYTWTDLDEKNMGNTIQYTIKEEEVEGYVSTVNSENIGNMIVTNKYKKVPVEVTPEEDERTEESGIYSVDPDTGTRPNVDGEKDIPSTGELNNEWYSLVGGLIFATVMINVFIKVKKLPKGSN